MTDDELTDLWIEYAEAYCNNTFDKQNLPSGVKFYIKNKFDNAKKDATVQSKSLSDMSITYFSKSELSQEEQDLLTPYKRIKVI